MLALTALLGDVFTVMNHVDSASRLQQEGMNSSFVCFWIALAVVYHLLHLVCFYMTTEAGGGGGEDEEGGCEFFSDFCPKRRERWYKCAKRCKKRCEKQTPTEECPLARCAMNLIKLHLPPPLPLKNNKKKSSKTKSSCCVPQDESKTTATTAASKQDAAREAQVAAVPLPHLVRRPSCVVPLIDLARMQYWKSVTEQVTRRGAKYRDSDGLYPLHWACSGGPPVEVVEALLGAYESAARKRDKEGSTALHFATHYSASIAVVKTVLQAYPKAVTVQDRYGRTPLYHAVEKSAGLDVLTGLAQADPSVITLPCLPHDKRDIPMSRTVAQRTPLYMAWTAVLLDRKTRESRRGKKWDKAILLLQAAYAHARGAKEIPVADFQFLSATIAFDWYLPEEIVPMAVTMHPGQLQEPDPRNGRIPLLQAAATKLRSRQRADDLLALLLSADPLSAQARDDQGKSALHLALESGKAWSGGVCRLFDANPDAIHWVDKQGLTPAMAAATVETASAGSTPVPKEVADENAMGLLTKKEKELLCRRRLEVLKPTADEQDLTGIEQLSTIFELLLKDPPVVPTGLGSGRIQPLLAH